MKILGVDFGPRRTGLAVSDEGETMALAVGCVEGTLEAVARAARDCGAQAIVVGLPRNMDGSLGPAARRAEKFAVALRVKAGMAVETFDERLTSWEARRKLAGIGGTRKKKKERENVVAAQLILEDYLRKKTSGRETPRSRG